MAPTPGNPNISWPTSRPGQPSPSPSPTPEPDSNTATTAQFDISLLPTGKKSLSGIALRAHLLGLILGLSLSFSLLVAIHLSSPLWRVPFFLASLCLFHFLEFYTTAKYNTRQAGISAFLLSSNGWAYNFAHGSAIVECLISHIFFSNTNTNTNTTQPTKTAPGLGLLVGLLWMALGQITRSLAMSQAGSNFNHNVQVERKEGHVLVQHGVYAVLRHPSYFGFFWWGLGTQLVLQNVVCLVGYAVVLWRFFANRIRREEEFLVAFFGEDYVDYRKRSWVGIPFI